MKNTFLIFVSIFFVFTVGIQAKTRIVEKPPYVYSSTTMLEIPRVTLTDTATIVDFDVYYRAGKTVKFSSTLSLVDGNGCRYAFRWCEGMVPGKRVRMPESGKLSLSLVFEPLPPKIRSFDFVEGPYENSWRIYGISLTGKLSDNKKEIKRLEKQRVSKSGLFLPDTGLTADSAIITGRIIGFRKDYGRQIEAWYNTVFDGRQQCVTGRVDDKGAFRLSLPVNVPTEVVFSYDHSLRFFVVPGEVVNVDINLAEWTRRGSRLLREQPSRERVAYFSGAMAGINDEKIHDTLQIGDFWQRYYSSLGKIKAFYKMSADDYKAYLLHRYDSLCVEIDRQPWSEAYKEINRINNAVWCALLLNRYSLSLRLSYRNFFDGPADAGLYAFAQQFEYPDSSYFDYVTMLRPYFDNGSIVWADRFGDLLGTMEGEVKLKKKTRPDLWKFIEEADSVHHFLSDEEKILVGSVSQKGYDSLTEGDKKRVWNIVGTHKKYLKFFLGVVSRRGKNAPLPAVFLGEKSVYFDWVEAQRCYEKIKENYTPLDQDDKASLRAMDDTMFYRILSAENDSLSAYLERNRDLSSRLDAPLDSLSGEELFAALIAPYRGKVVLVDFWETWCSPCRIAMQQMIPLKKELAGKDIVYLYLATEGSSDKKAWKNLIEAVPGYHILLSLRQGRSLSSLLGISGVPTFIIVDRQGNRMKKLTGYPGVEVMKHYLLDAQKR